MKVASVRAADLASNARLDARFFSAPAVRIKRLLAEARDVKLRSVRDLATVRAPKRFKRVYAVPGEKYVPYLRPYDVFEFLPPEADRLSVSRTRDLDSYRIASGDLLQTCSGRNLGPVTIADDYLAGFVLSHDMVRISIDDEVDRYYALAVLQSRFGQALLRADLNGSVIDHINAEHVEAVMIPFVESIRDEVSSLMKMAVETRASARSTLRSIVGSIDAQFSPAPSSQREGWTVHARGLGSRLDAAYHSEYVTAVRADLIAAGGAALADYADIRKPGGRPKLYYVEPGQGTPLLSGRQILQLDVVGAKDIASRSMDKDSGYGLGAGWIVFQADGRAEESLGYPAVVLNQRADWFASGHVGRAIPKNPSHTGLVWAAMASKVVQDQISAIARGSVVDALYERDIERVVIPPISEDDARAAQEAWDDLSVSVDLSAKAIKLVEVTLSSFGL